MVFSIMRPTLVVAHLPFAERQDATLLVLVADGCSFELRPHALLQSDSDNHFCAGSQPCDMP